MIWDIFWGICVMIGRVLADQPDPKGPLLNALPESARPWVSILLSISPILMVFPGIFALATWLERKGLGRLQNRPGPNRVGPFGLFQPIADGIKMLTKEDIVPRAADKVVHFLAPVALVIPVFLTYSVLPIGRHLQALDLDAGVLFFLAVGASTELAVFMAGWSSRNKYALLGAMRGVAQTISYELPLAVSALTAVMLSGTLSPAGIVQAQSGTLFGVHAWNLWTPWGFAGFILFFIAAAAESNRSPFDIPEAESEIIAGYLVEYSGFKYALFFLGEYLGMFAVSGMAITLFLGGWLPPLAILGFVPSWLWFFAKLFALLALLIWARGTLPRLRTDQLMGFAWKFMLPLAFINMGVAAAWYWTAAWQFPGALLLRWVLCAGLIAGPYVMLGRALSPARAPRTYRLATE